jgi:transcriptional regulator with XRE-family HTH domain
MGHIWPVLKTASEILGDLGAAVRERRLALGLSQEQAAMRAGVGLRTWRRLESHGHATLETVVNAALVLRCEQHLSQLFPAPAAASLDDILKQQAASEGRRRRALRGSGR